MKVKLFFKRFLFLIVAFFYNAVLFAQQGDVTRAFGEIQNSLKSYVDAVSNICLIVGALIGMIGGVRIFI